MSEAEITVVAHLNKLATPKLFFDAVRKVTGAFDLEQMTTLQAMLDSAGHWPASWLAYGLATAWHEARFTPQAEWGHGKGHPYAEPGKYRQPQYGRGLVQLTWDRNYEWADKALGLNGALLKNFDLALEPDIAVRILVKGMQEGAFTGKGLGDYLPDDIGTFGQFTLARRVINGNDKAALIADHAVKFQDALSAGGWA